MSSQKPNGGLFCAPKIGAQNGGTCFDRAGLIRIIKIITETTLIAKLIIIHVHRHPNYGI